MHNDADGVPGKSMASHLEAAERETTITSTDADREVRIWTCQRKYLGRLRRDRRFTETAGGFYGTTEWAEFTIPAASWNPVTGAKRAGRPLTDEQRARAAETLQRYREAG